MPKYCKLTFALALFLSTLVVPVAAIAATAPKPKVVFYGDGFTYGWTTIANTPGWVNRGAPTIYTSDAMGSALAGFQSEVVSLHPAIVHIMFGETDSLDLSPNTQQFYGPGSLSSAQQMVAEAKAANIQVIFGLSPGVKSQFAQLITMYGAAHGIPVIDYADALTGGTGFNGAGTWVDFGFADSPSNGDLQPDPAGFFSVPTLQGQALMTQMATAVINTIGLKLTGGYLQNYSNYEVGGGPNINGMVLSQEVQFTPYGQYTGGVVEPLIGLNYLTGTNGTWTSSNPLVAQVNQQGHVWALTVGKTSISYISPTGVHFSPWTMTVWSYGNQLGPSQL
jgi:Bacterial Ig-like domain (group 2)